jgi:hypothetical protein
MQANEKGTIVEVGKELSIDPENVRCGGCKSDVRFIGCRDCYIRSCAERKELNYCFECNDFPCEYFEQFLNLKPHLISTTENLETIKSKGLEIWLEEQKIRWQCSNCLEKFSWYQFECQSCSNPVNGYNYQKDPHLR